jgi:hypothetical protein
MTSESTLPHSRKAARTNCPVGKCWKLGTNGLSGRATGDDMYHSPRGRRERRLAVNTCLQGGLLPRIKLRNVLRSAPVCSSCVDVVGFSASGSLQRNGGNRNYACRTECVSKQAVRGGMSAEMLSFLLRHAKLFSLRCPCSVRSVIERTIPAVVLNIHYLPWSSCRVTVLRFRT